MIDLSSILIKSNSTLRKAIEVIDKGKVQIALVVDTGQRLLGTVTDGDIRRALLRGETLDSPVENFMNSVFHSLPIESSDQKVETMMRDHLLHHIPGLDSEGRVKRLFIQREMVQDETLTNWVVLMAGGEGKRLRPATDNCPKPMLKVGGIPILEIILQQCIKSGFRNYFISVNYLKEQIMEYFGDGSYWGVNIQYLEENQPLGTAGALSQLHKTLTQTLLVINGDVLTRADYRSLLRFHREQNASVTLCVHEDETRIPYGVVTSKDYQMETIQEKPVISNNIIAGIYALEPDMLKLLPSNQFCDMPDLIEMGKEQCKSVFVFPIHEYWLDIGHPAALDMANGEWGRSDE